MVDYVSGSSYTNSGSSTSIPIPGFSVSTGNLLVVGMRWEGGGATDTATASLADTAGNTYTLLGYQSTGSGEGHRIAVFYCLSAVGNASNAITVTISASRTYRQAYAAQYSYSGTLQLGDTGSGANGGNTTTVTSSPALTAKSGDVVVGVNGQFNSTYTFTPNAGYTARDALGLLALFDNIPSGSFNEAPGGTYSSTGDSYVILTAVFESGTQQYSYTAAGGLTLSGAAGINRIRLAAPAGGLVLSGSSNRAMVRAEPSPSGGLTFSGSALFAKGFSVSAAGGLNFAGTSPQVRKIVPLAAGGIIFSGQADYSTHTAGNSYSYTAQGGITFGGASPAVRKVTQSVSGGLVFSGHADYSTYSAGTNQYSYTAQGGIIFSGTADVQQIGLVNNWVAGTLVAGTGILQTIYLADGTPVPGGAVFINGIAHSPDGYRYICPWPSVAGVAYNAGRAIREDGAQIVALSMTVSGYHSGFGLSYRGEQYISLTAEGRYKDGLGIRSVGSLPVSDAS